MAQTIFTNDAQTTVTSGGTTAPSIGTQETWTVSSSSSFPAASSSATFPTAFHVADIASGKTAEKMQVINVSGTTWTVIRGADNTTTIAHNSGFTIQQVVTSTDFAQLSVVEWYNVQTQGGAKGDGVTDDTTAIQDAATACPSGGVLYFPRGNYVTSAPITISTGGVSITGPLPASQSGNGYGAPASGFTASTVNHWGAQFIPSASFAQGGSAANAVFIFDNAIRYVMENIWIDGVNLTSGTNGSVDGIQGPGSTRAGIVRRVAINSMPGTGMNTPNAQTIEDVLIQLCGGNGITTSLGDCVITGIHMQANHGYGMQATGGGGIIANSRFDMSGLDGLYIETLDDTQGANATVVNGIWTERNYGNAVTCTTSDATGTGPGSPIIINGASLSADGVNAGSGGGSYAGLNILGGISVTVTNLSVAYQDFDVSTGCPQYAVHIHTGGTSSVAPMLVQILGGMLEAADSTYVIYGGQVPLAREYDVWGHLGKLAAAQAYTHLNYDSGTLVHA